MTRSGERTFSIPTCHRPAGGSKVIWSHPAFANRRLYARNDHEIICVSLAASQ